TNERGSCARSAALFASEEIPMVGSCFELEPTPRPSRKWCSVNGHFLRPWGSHRPQESSRLPFQIMCRHGAKVIKSLASSRRICERHERALGTWHGSNRGGIATSLRDGRGRGKHCRTPSRIPADVVGVAPCCSAAGPSRFSSHRSRLSWRRKLVATSRRL